MGTVTVMLCDLPLDLWSTVRQWFEEVRREFALAAFTLDAAAADAQQQISEISDRQAQLLGTRDRGAEQMWAAREAGQATADITYRAVAGAAEVSREMVTAMDFLDVYCRSGALLTLPRNRRQVAFCHWYFGEIAAQVAGAAPTPWSEALVDGDTGRGLTG